MAAVKKTYEGLNKAFIEKYISIQSNADDLNKQYAKATEMGKFPLVRKWFLNTFKNFNLEEAKKEIEQDALRKISAASAEKQSNVRAPASLPKIKIRRRSDYEPKD